MTIFLIFVFGICISFVGQTLIHFYFDKESVSVIHMKFAAGFALAAVVVFNILMLTNHG